MPNPMGASMRGVSGIPVGERILLLAYAGRGALTAVPDKLRDDVPRVLDRLSLHPRAMDAVRQFLEPRKHYPPTPRPSDREVVESLGRAVGRGEIAARVIGQALTHPSFAALARNRSVQSAIAAAPTSRDRLPTSSPPGAPTPVAGPVRLGASPSLSPSTPTGTGAAIADAGLAERLEEVLRRAAARAPGGLGARLTAFATPPNLALLAGGVLATAPSGASRSEWTTHPTVAAIGFAYAGLAAFPALADVHDFAARTGGAKSAGDLDAAAAALARATAVFGVIGVASLLHRSSGEPLGVGTDPGAPPEAPPPPSAASATAGPGARPALPPIPAPTGELAAARAAAAKLRAAEASVLQKAQADLALARKAYADAVAKLRARADGLLARARAEKAALEKRVAALKAEAEKEEAALLKEKAALEKKLADAKAELKKEEAKLEKIAHDAQAERKAIAERLKALQDEAKRDEAYARNIAKYGDKLGPTIDQLKKSGKSAEQIIKSAGQTGGKPLGL